MVLFLFFGPLKTLLTSSFLHRAHVALCSASVSDAVDEAADNPVRLVTSLSHCLAQTDASGPLLLRAEFVREL